MLLALFLGTGHTTLGFEQAGHFYTISMAASMLQPPLTESQALFVSFCTQLPDHAADLSATGAYALVRKDWKSPGALVRWLRKNEADSEGIRRMVTVQQLVHGLTGGTASAVRDVAGRTVQTLRQQATRTDSFANWCAVGFALHLYGDSFAHRVMGDPGDDPDKVYSTGQGHAWHLHYPDWPLCGQLKPKSLFNLNPIRNCESARFNRFEEWAQYWKEASGFLVPGSSVNQLVYDRIVTEVRGLANSAADYNDWEEPEMAGRLAQAGAVGAAGSFLAAQGSSKPCESVLALALDTEWVKRVVGNRGPSEFTCGSAWSTFYKVVVDEYNKNKDAREERGTDFKSAYLDNPFLTVQESSPK